MPTLEELYREMAAHTAPECAKNCTIPHSCCNTGDCEMTERLAWELKGVRLEPTGHTIKFMGPTGCTVPPHLRPLCTLHTCAINSFGFKPGDRPWTEKYFRLRDAIDQAEFEAFVEKS